MQTPIFQELHDPSQRAIVNVASVTQLSPFRYPGGKTWFVPYALEWLKSLPNRPRVLVDPFFGGGSVPLAALNNGLVSRLALREVDEDVAAVWASIFSDSNERLCKRILGFPITRETVVAELETFPRNTVDRAFKTILRNRTYRGGILAKGASLMNNGENGRGVASRWYPQTLVTRIRGLGLYSNQIDFACGDGFQLIKQFAGRRSAGFFIDPPYTAGNGKRAGTRLYDYNRVDHEHLFAEMARAVGHFLMTYDDDPYVQSLAEHFGFKVNRVPMKNTHHEKKFELVISGGGKG